MTLKLRRVHRTIWLVLAVLLPVSFGAALFMAEKPLRQEPFGLLSADSLALSKATDSLQAPTFHTFHP